MTTCLCTVRGGIEYITYLLYGELLIGLDFDLAGLLQSLLFNESHLQHRNHISDLLLDRLNVRSEGISISNKLIHTILFISLRTSSSLSGRLAIVFYVCLGSVD